MRGWLATIRRERSVLRQTKPYFALSELLQYCSSFSVAHFDDAAAHMFITLRPICARLGTMDLKVASIALVHDALLLTANRRDFEKVPGLKFENWLD